MLMTRTANVVEEKIEEWDVERAVSSTPVLMDVNSVNRLHPV